MRLCLSVLALALVACGEGRHDVREWRASDHAPPPDDHAGDSQRQGDRGEEDPPQADARTAALMLWQTNCVPCHGAEGHGDGPAKPPVAQIPDMTDAGWQASRTDQQLGMTIVQGHGMMPAFGQQLSPEGIAVLVMYVRGLGGQMPHMQAPPTPPDAPAPPPASPPPD